MTPVSTNRLISCLKKVFIDPNKKGKPTIIGIKIGINAILGFIELSKCVAYKAIFESLRHLVVSSIIKTPRLASKYNGFKLNIEYF